MTFIDSNVPMYLIGAAHPHKIDAQMALSRLSASRERLVTDAEVMQEVLHRYSALGRKDAIEEAIHLILEIVDEVFPIEGADVIRASEILRSRSQLSARDALHIAIMQRHRIRSILSFDRDFEGWPGLARISS